MSKKRKNSSRPAPTKAPSQPAPNKASAPVTPAPKTKPTVAPSNTAAPARRNWVWLAALLPVMALVAGAIVLLSRNNAPAAPATSAASNPSAGQSLAPIDRFVGTMGGVTGCRKQPPFTEKLGFGKATVLSTAERTMKGLVLVEQQSNNAAPRTYQDPSWTMGGYLGPSAIDKDGNMYLAPSPRVNLIDNPPERANIVYRVDGQTGAMAEFLNLPAVQAASPTNPYGVLGLAYDCDTHSLYVSSVAGSTRAKENGRIFRLDMNTGKVVSQVNDVDAMGLGVFNGTKGKRLYFGSARVQDVRSVELDKNGNFYGAPRVEFSLEGLGPDGNDKARKISFDRANDMTINGTKFNYNLAPPVAQLLPAAYRYRYDGNSDSWTYVDTTTGPGSAVQ